PFRDRVEAVSSSRPSRTGCGYPGTRSFGNALHHPVPCSKRVRRNIARLSCSPTMAEIALTEFGLHLLVFHNYFQLKIASRAVFTQVFLCQCHISGKRRRRKSGIIFSRWQKFLGS